MKHRVPKRCTFCGHLWRFHAITLPPTLGTCTKCRMKPSDVRPWTIKSGVVLGVARHSLAPKHPHCHCLMSESPGCSAVVFHGPGHQSHTHCQKRGKHDIHKAQYGGQLATWRKPKACSGFFDEAPEAASF